MSLLLNPYVLTYIIAWLIGFTLATYLTTSRIRHAVNSMFRHEEENGEYYDYKEYVDVTDKLIEDKPAQAAKPKPRKTDNEITIEQVQTWLANNPEVTLEAKANE